MKKKRKSYIFSLFGLFGLFFLSIFLYFFFQQNYEKKKKDPRYFILSVMQTGPKKEALSTRYLCELLNLSIDKPLNLYAFDLQGAKEKLLHSSVIEKAELKKIFPNTLYIDYTTRTPIAWLDDFENILIDNQGFFFPALPFFSPKNLPQIYLGLEDKWAKKKEKRIINCSKLEQAFSLLNRLKHFKNHNFQVKRIDVSSLFADSYGKRQIVVILEHEKLFSHMGKRILGIFPHILRLNTNDFSKQLGNYSVLLKKMMDDYEKQVFDQPDMKNVMKFKPKVIDLRIEKMAFID